MSKLYVHVGMHKTGSSSIQKSLDKSLQDNKFAYLHFKKSNHSGYIHRFFSNVPVITKEDVLRNKKVDSSLVSQLSNNNIDSFITSGEGIIRLDETELNSLKNYFLEHADAINIIAYVRSPKSYIESAFQQILKAEFINFDLNKAYPNYRDRFEKFDTVFGCENVILWKFEPKSFPANDVVLDFCEKLEIPFDPAKVIRVNESLSTEAVALLYFYRKYGPKQDGLIDRKVNKRLIERIAKIGNSKFKFSPVLIEPLLNKNRFDIEWMENRLGASLREDMKEGKLDISSEEQLSKIAVDNVKYLKEIIDPEFFPEGVLGNTAEEVAVIMDSLRKQELSKYISNKSIIEGNVMAVTMNQIVEKLKTESPKIDEKELRKLVRSTLNHLKEEITDSDAQVVNIASLGKFRKKEVEKDDQKSIRFIFIPNSSDKKSDKS